MGIIAEAKIALGLRRKEMEIRSLAVGMNSTVDITRDLHIVMMDYDIAEKAKVIESVRELQKFWRLSDCELFRTKHGYHAFFWYDHVPYGRLKMIIEFARYVDPLYKAISALYDHKTIRVAGKYPERDIVASGFIIGSRRPSVEEKELGDMKRMEHTQLSSSSLHSPPSSEAVT
jgi:hypothetical protein